MASTGSAPVDDPAWRWTVDGISPEAQEAARQAAEREKLPLGAWMEAAIVDAVERGLDEGGKSAPPLEDPRPQRRYF
ncbi:MAG: hypothetical protein ACXWUV_17685 [Allosphingosinicella sp.]